MKTPFISADTGQLNKLSELLRGFPEEGGKIMNRVLLRATDSARTGVLSIIPNIYGIPQKQVKEALNGSSRKRGVKMVRGTQSVSVEVVGERGLTITRFSHTPTDKPKTKNGKPRRYQAKVTVFKEKGKIPLGPVRGEDGSLKPVFLAPVSETHKDKLIFFHSTGKKTAGGRESIKPVLTVAIPQMVPNEKVAIPLVARINETMEKRIEHELNYAFGNLGSNLAKE